MSIKFNSDRILAMDDSEPQYRFNVGSGGVGLAHETHGKIASVTPHGLICERTSLIDKTTKEFAEIMLEFLISFTRNHDFKAGTLSVMAESKPILVIQERDIDLNAVDGMSLFDQWVFMRVQQLWKHRKV